MIRKNKGWTYSVILIVASISWSMGVFYQSVKTTNGMVRGTVEYKRNLPSLTSCMHRCNLKGTSSVFENGFCTCMIENDAGHQTIPASMLWRKGKLILFYYD